MSHPLRRPAPLTVEQYLELEEASPVKHDYLAGEVYALAGATKRHNAIAINISRRLGNAAEGGPCRVYMSDVKLRVGDIFYYPDVIVACGPEEGDPLIEAPCLLVEVLSPSTEMIDRREKVMVYKRISTLQAYLIVEQVEPRVERYWCGPDGVWRHEEITGPVPVPLSCPQMELRLEEIYQGLNFQA